MSQIEAQLSSHLLQSKGITPLPGWITTFLSSQRPTTPLPSLIQSALFRLLSSDISISLVIASSTCFPDNIHDVHCTERRLSGPIAVQVMSVEDLSKSRWEQIEAIEAAERGELKKGREIIRVARVEEDGTAPLSDAGAAVVGKSCGPHKLLLKDAAGTYVWALELRRVDDVNVEMSIGSKFVLKNIRVTRGTLLIEASTAKFLGGKIDPLHTAWMKERKEILKRRIDDAERKNR